MLTLTGGLINAVQTTMFALAAHVYPTAIRASGVGTVVAFGRLGAILVGYAGPWALEYRGQRIVLLVDGRRAGRAFAAGAAPRAAGASRCPGSTHLTLSAVHDARPQRRLIVRGIRTGCDRHGRPRIRDPASATAAHRSERALRPSGAHASALEGFTHLIPFAAGHEIIRQGLTDLTLIRMTPDLIYDQMIGCGCARKLVFSWGGNPGVGSLHRLRDAVERGWPRPLEIEEHSHSAMAHAYAAGAAGMPCAVFADTWVRSSRR